MKLVLIKILMNLMIIRLEFLNIKIKIFYDKNETTKFNDKNEIKIEIFDDN
jgi:hypothetical protein